MRTGDIILVHHSLRFTLLSICQWIIRLLTVSKWDHVGIILVENGNTYVVEATLSDGIKKTLYKEYTGSLRGYFGVRRSIYPISEDIISTMIKSQIGKPYDFLSIWHQLIYNITKRIKNNILWLGRTDNGKADEKWYCSEFVAWCHGIEDWYMYNPEDLNSHYDFYVIDS